MSDGSERQKRLLGLLASGRQLSMLAVAGEAKYTLRNTAEALRMLVLRGFVERSQDGAFSATASGIGQHASGAPFRDGPIAKTRRPPPPLQNTLRQRAWSAMRLNNRWTIDDLLTLAARSSDKQPYGALQKYVHALCRAEIVVVLPKRVQGTAPTSNGAKVYKLLRNSGERAPSIQRDGSVRDHNQVAA